MKAVAIQEFGGPAGLAVIDLDVPAPAAGQVLIATEAIAARRPARSGRRRARPGQQPERRSSGDDDVPPESNPLGGGGDPVMTASGKGFATLWRSRNGRFRVTSELLAWIGTLDERTRAQVVDAIDRLAEAGPALGRPLVDSIAHSTVRNLKELRPGSAGRSEVRI